MKHVGQPAYPGHLSLTTLYHHGGREQLGVHIWMISSSNQGLRVGSICQFRDEDQMYRVPYLQAHPPVTSRQSFPVTEDTCSRGHSASDSSMGVYEWWQHLLSI